MRGGTEKLLSGHNRCISETAQLITNRKSHTRFRFVLKSIILGMDDLKRPLRTLLHYACVFVGAHHVNLNNDRSTLSAAKMYPWDFSFW